VDGHWQRRARVGQQLIVCNSIGVPKLQGMLVSADYKVDRRAEQQHVRDRFGDLFEDRGKRPELRMSKTRGLKRTDPHTR